MRYTPRKVLYLASMPLTFQLVVSANEFYLLKNTFKIDVLSNYQVEFYLPATMITQLMCGTHLNVQGSRCCMDMRIGSLV